MVICYRRHRKLKQMESASGVKHLYFCRKKGHPGPQDVSPYALRQSKCQQHTVGRSTGRNRVMGVCGLGACEDRSKGGRQATSPGPSLRSESGAVMMPAPLAANCQPWREEAMCLFLFKGNERKKGESSKAPWRKENASACSSEVLPQSMVTGYIS